MTYNKKDITFIRFGNLSPVKQKSYKNNTYHSAPVKKGIYAFVHFMIEPFLLGGYNKLGTKYSKRKYIKDNKGNKIIIGKFYEDINKPPVKGEEEYDDHFEWSIHLTDDEIERLEKRYSKQKNLFLSSQLHRNGNIYLETLIKPKNFKYTGNIWHHLIEETPEHLILKLTEYWVLTDFNTYVKSFNKALHNKVKEQNSFRKDSKLKPVLKSRYKQFSKDHFEVFIEKV